MISKEIYSNQDVAAFMSLARMNMLAKSHKFESLLRSGRMKRVSYGIKELKLRNTGSRTADIPEIAFSEALLNTGFAGIKVVLSDARRVMVRAVDRILSSALGKTTFDVVISAYIPDEYHTLHIIMFDRHLVGDENGDVRQQAMKICVVSAHEDFAKKIKVAMPELEIDANVESEIRRLHHDSVSNYLKDQEVIAVFDLERMEGLREQLDGILNLTEGMKMEYEIFISAGITTPLMGMSIESRTRFDGTVVESPQKEFDQKAEEYQRDTDLLDSLGDDFLEIGGEYPWKFALTFMSEGAFYGYEWERKGSIFQDMRYKHPVAKLKVKGGATHKFILHWDGESYRIEITDMEPDSDLGKEMISCGLSFEITPMNTKKKK